MEKKNPDVNYAKLLEKNVPEQLFCSACEEEIKNAERSPGNDTDGAVAGTSQTMDDRLIPFPISVKIPICF